MRIPRWHLLLLTASIVLAILFACRPPLEGSDPKGLIWDEAPEEGFRKILRLKTVNEGVRVLFWNVMYGHLNAGHFVDRNLKALVQSNVRPDIIVLAEYRPEALEDETVRFLKSEYPYSTFYPYNENDDAPSKVGIGVFSTFPFEQTLPINLSWLPTRATVVEQFTYEKDWGRRFPKQVAWWDRAYSMFNYSIPTPSGMMKMSLVPVHLLEPWDAMSDKDGVVSTWSNMMFSKTNPLYHQIERLLGYLRADLGGDLNAQPLLLIGDLNVPPRVLGVHPEAWDLLESKLDDAFPGTPASFPAFSAPVRQQPPFKYGMVKLDHAFTNKKAEWLGAAVLTLRGSDHYPIYVIVSPKVDSIQSATPGK